MPGRSRRVAGDSLVGREGERPAARVVDDRAEDAGRIEAGHAEPVDGTVQADESDGPAWLGSRRTRNRQISPLTPHLMDSVRGTACRSNGRSTARPGRLRNRRFVRRELPNSVDPKDRGSGRAGAAAAARRAGARSRSLFFFLPPVFASAEAFRSFSSCGRLGRLATGPHLPLGPAFFLPRALRFLHDAAPPGGPDPYRKPFATFNMRSRVARD